MESRFMRVLDRLYPYRRTLTWTLHAGLVTVAFVGAHALRFDFRIPPEELRRLLVALPYLIVLRPLSFHWFGLFRDYWRHVGMRDLLNLTAAVTVSSLGFLAILIATGQVWGMSRAVVLLDWLLAIFLVGGFRFGIRLLREARALVRAPQGARTLVIGAGEAGEHLLRQILHDGRHRMHVIGLIDDDPGTHGRSLHGVRVLGGTRDLRRLVADCRIELIVIAIPSATGAQLRSIVDRCAESRTQFKIVPTLEDLLGGRAEIAHLRDVELEDLLGRESVRLDLARVERDLAGKTVLITGGAGSIGSELARQIAGFGPRRIILLERAENTLYFVWVELRHTHPDVEVVPVIASITNAGRLAQVFRAYRPDYVFHAAASKHVPLCETNAVEAAWNNVVGTLRVAEAAARWGVKKFVLISTDKAVNPTSVLGVTKRVAERVVLELPYLAASDTDFRAVRFGNVLGSDGSVLPLFKRQLAAGGPLTVTDPRVKRYFMTIPEAVQLLLQAAALPEAAGRIAMLEMGEQVRVLELAEQLIRLSGRVPHRDVEIRFTGLRPGEKMVEQLVASDETAHPTSVDKIQVIETPASDPTALRKGLSQLIHLMTLGDEDELLRGIAALVPGYEPWQGSTAARAVATGSDAGAVPTLAPALRTGTDA